MNEVESLLLNIGIEDEEGYMSYGTCISIDSTGDFKYLIRAARKQLQVSQTEFAKMLDTNQATISQWEQGVVTPTLQTILRISNFIEMPILIGRP